MQVYQGEDNFTSGRKNTPQQPAISLLADRLRALPARLRSKNHFIASRGKVPVDPVTGIVTSVTSPYLGVSLESALQFVANGGADGVGIVLFAGGNLTCIDIDDCLDAEGQPGPGATAILDLLPSAFVEISHSGRGLHAWLNCQCGVEHPVRCALDGLGQNFEVYQSGRFIVVTGNKPSFEHGQGSLCEDSTDDLLALISHSKGAQTMKSTFQEAIPSKPTVDGFSRLADNDRTVIRRIRSSEKGPKFHLLFDLGDFTACGYPSASEADMGLAGLVYPWTGCDKAQTMRIVTESALGRLDGRARKYARPKYLDNTVDKVERNFDRSMKADAVSEQANDNKLFGILGNRSIGPARHTAAALYHLRRQFETDNNGTRETRMRVTRAELEALTGYPPRTVTGHLRSLEAAGLITRHNESLSRTSMTAEGSQSRFFSILLVELAGGNAESFLQISSQFEGGADPERINERQDSPS